MRTYVRIEGRMREVDMTADERMEVATVRLARLEALGDEIASLAAHIEAATCRWLGLIARYDASGAWTEWGCRSCAEWLAHRCSLSATSAREHVRVACRLQSLPLIRQA